MVANFNKAVNACKYFKHITSYQPLYVCIIMAGVHFVASYAAADTDSRCRLI